MAKRSRGLLVPTVPAVIDEQAPFVESRLFSDGVYEAWLETVEPYISPTPDKFHLTCDPMTMKKMGDRYFYTTPFDEWTLSALCIHLGIKHEQLIDYGEMKKHFRPLIDRYKLMVAEAYERRLQLVGSPGYVFALKNLGWKDKVEITNKNVDINDIMKEIEKNAGHVVDVEAKEADLD